MTNSNTTDTQPLQRLIYRILLAGGLMVLALGIALTLPGLKPLTWPSTTGTIIGHRIERNANAQLAVVVRYRYEIGGTRYRGEKFSHNSTALTPWHPNPEVALGTYKSDPAYTDYQKDKKVTVYYDAADPSNAVLKRGVEPSGIVALLLGILFIGAALFERRRLKQLSVAAK